MEWTLERVAWMTTAVSPPVILGSAYIVYRQVKEASDTLRGHLFDTTSQRMLDLTRLFVEYPELRPFFYENCNLDGADAALRNRVLAAAELHIDFFDTELLRRRVFRRRVRDLPAF
jgi:hypothetical protein